MRITIGITFCVSHDHSMTVKPFNMYMENKILPNKTHITRFKYVKNESTTPQTLK